ncbi:MAG: outer membrane beta-barrel protein [Verrucomicrobiia bacterium]
MKCNKWTLALAAAGVVSLGSIAQAEEAQHQVLTALSSTTLSGYVDTSAIWNIGSDKHDGTYTGIPGRTFDGTGDKLDGFNLHAVKMTLEKPLDEGQWAAGYKADLVFGPDANYYSTLLNGAGNDQDDFAIKQAYVALRAPVGNGIDFKVGVLDTIVGYEVFESANNPNFSRSYGYLLEPAHHTGLLASYHVTDWLSVSGGVAETAYGPVNGKGHQFGEAESSKTYMGSVVVTMPDATGFLAGSVLYAGIVDGSVFGRGTAEDATHLYVGGTIPTPLEGLSVGAAWDYREDGPTFAATVDNRAYSLAGYLSYAITEKFTANARVDYLNAEAGTFYPVDADFNTEELIASTLTLDYSLWDNVVTRAEVRWDHSLTGDQPYGNNNDKDAVTLAANIVYKF